MHRAIAIQEDRDRDPFDGGKLPTFRASGSKNSKLLPGVFSKCDFDTLSSRPTSRFWTTPTLGLSTPQQIIDGGAKKIYPIGWDMAAFEYRQAEEIRDIFQRRGVRYLFLGKSGAILLGFPDTER